MKVNITGVFQELENLVSVTFQTSIGAGKGIWHSDLPQIGQEYYVEIDIPDTLRWGQNIVEANNKAFSLTVSGETLRLCGQIEQVDDDGCLVLRLGDALMLLDAETEQEMLGSFVEITTSQIHLYNMNI